MTIRMYANRKELALDDVEVRLAHDREYRRDCEGCEEAPRQVDVLRRWIRLDGELTEAERARLLEIADRCPVHRTLTGTIRVETHELAGDAAAAAD